MALDYSGFGTVTETGGDQYKQFSNLAQNQSGQAFDFGNQAAKYADPFMTQRSQYQGLLKDAVGAPQDSFYQDQIKSLVSNTGTNPYQTQFDALLANPGAIESSPYLKYLMETQMNQVNASNAAGGFRNSGRGLMALQDRAAGVASQGYGQQAGILQNAMNSYNSNANSRVGTLSNIGAQIAAQNNARVGQLGTLSGATTSSPAAAGLAFTGGANRMQDLQQMAQAARSFQPQKQPAPATPMSSWPTMGGNAPASTGLPTGGGSPSYGGQDPRTMSLAQLQAEMGSYGPGGANYSPGRGTGYVSTEGGGTTTFNGGVGTYEPGSYSTGNMGDNGYTDFSNPDLYGAGFQVDPYASVGLTAPTNYGGFDPNAYNQQDYIDYGFGEDY